MVLAQKQIGRSIEQNRDPRNKSRTGYTGQPHAKELNWTILCHTQKLVQNVSKI